MIWDLEKGSRDGVKMSRETEELETTTPQNRSHKNGKLDTATFKLIGQKLHASGPEPTKNEQINSHQDIKAAAIPVSVS